MNLFFYIEMKRKNENLIKQIEDIINSYDDVISYINNNCEYNYVTDDLLYFYRSLMLENKEDLKIIKEVIKLNDNKIIDKKNIKFIIKKDKNLRKEQLISSLIDILQYKISTYKFDDEYIDLNNFELVPTYQVALFAPL